MLDNIKNDQVITEAKQEDTKPVSTQEEIVNAKVATEAKSKQPQKLASWPTNKKGGNTRVSASGFEEKVVAIKRISKTTKGGRSMRFSALVVIGDKKGSIGFGMGKSIEVPNAIKKAIKNARNNTMKVIMTNNGSVYHDVIGKAGAGRVLLKPAKEGTGLIAGGAIRAVIELAGFKDIYTKNLGKNTPHNMIQATINGLLAQLTPKSIAVARDKETTKL